MLLYLLPPTKEEVNAFARFQLSVSPSVSKLHDLDEMLHCVLTAIGT